MIDVMTLNRKDIFDIREEAAKAVHDATGYFPGRFEPSALNELDSESINKLYEAINKKHEKYLENADLCIICDMALLYLEEHCGGGKND